MTKSQYLCLEVDSYISMCIVQVQVHKRLYPSSLRKEHHEGLVVPQGPTLEKLQGQFPVPVTSWPQPTPRRLVSSWAVQCICLQSERSRMIYDPHRGRNSLGWSLLSSRWLSTHSHTQPLTLYICHCKTQRWARAGSKTLRPSQSVGLVGPFDLVDRGHQHYHSVNHLVAICCLSAHALSEAWDFLFFSARF